MYAKLQVDKCPIGVGSYGRVYKGRHPQFGSCAVKIVRIRSQPEAVVSMIRREIRVQKNISHPNLCALLDSDFRETYRSFVILVTPLYEFNLSRIRKVPLDHVQDLFGQLVSGIAYLQFGVSPPVLHRDLKPDNVFVKKDATRPSGLQICIGDFGFARECSATDKSRALCTPLYAAPALLRARCGVRSLSRKDDLWSLGALLYYLVVGSAPFQGSTEAEIMQLQKKPLARPSRFSKTPEGSAAWAVVTALLQDDEAKRASLEDLVVMPWVVESPGLQQLPPVISALVDRRRAEMSAAQAANDPVTEAADACTVDTTREASSDLKECMYAELLEFDDADMPFMYAAFVPLETAMADDSSFVRASKTGVVLQTDAAFSELTTCASNDRIAAIHADEVSTRRCGEIKSSACHADAATFETTIAISGTANDADIAVVNDSGVDSSVIRCSLLPREAVDAFAEELAMFMLVTLDEGMSPTSPATVETSASNRFGGEVGPSRLLLRSGVAMRNANFCRLLTNHLSCRNTSMIALGSARFTSNRER